MINLNETRIWYNGYKFRQSIIITMKYKLVVCLSYEYVLRCTTHKVYNLYSYFLIIIDTHYYCPSRTLTMFSPV